jgi:hypothetical protein
MMRMQRINRREFLHLAGAIVILGTSGSQSCGSRLSKPQSLKQQQKYLKPEEYALLEEMFRVHLNYFLSPEVITGFGFPMTAYKVKLPAQRAGLLKVNGNGSRVTKAEPESTS